MNKDISKEIQLTYRLAIAFSISLVVSVPLVVFGRNISALLIIGVILLIPGVYGAIIMWLHYGRLHICKAALPVINDKDIRDITKVATTIHKPLVFTRIAVKYLVSKRYIVGYRLTEYDILEKISKKDRKLSNNQCPTCGARVNINKSTACKRCGTELIKK